MRKAACILLASMALIMTVSCSLRGNGSNAPDEGKNETSVNDSSAKSIGLTSDDGLSGSTRMSDAKQPDIYPAKDTFFADSKWGYIDSAGMFVIQPSFSQAFRFQKNGRAVAGRGDSVGIIDRTGSFIAEPVYTSINQYAEGLAVAADTDGYIVLDEDGRAISAKYQYIGDYKSGRAVYYVQTLNGSILYGYLDENGKPVIQPVYLNATDFEGSRAVVKLSDGLYAIIDRSGTVIKTLEYWEVSGFSDGKAAFRAYAGGKFGYIDSGGNEIIKPSFIYAGEFRNGRAVVSVPGGPSRTVRGLIDETGRFVINPEYDEILMLGEDRIALGTARDPNNIAAGSRFALADADGKLLTDFIFYSIEPFSNGVASATDSTSTYFINTSGKKMQTLPSAEGAGYMEILGGLIYANIDQRMSYINQQGHVIYEPADSITTSTGVRVCEEKYKPNIDYLVYYPVLGNMADLKLEAEVNAKLMEMWTDISTASIKPSDILDYHYEGGFSLVFSRKGLIVLSETGYSYPFGAAHGMPVMNHVHIDVRTGRFYELKDLFKKGSNYTGILTQIVRDQITEMAQSEDTLYWLDSYDGISSDQQFYINENGLNLYFQPYEIAPYAAGFPTFLVTFDEISDIIDKDGDFWRSFN